MSVYPIAFHNPDTKLFDYRLIDQDGNHLDTGLSTDRPHEYCTVVIGLGLKPPFMLPGIGHGAIVKHRNATAIRTLRVGRVAAWLGTDPAVYAVVSASSVVLVPTTAARIALGNTALATGIYSPQILQHDIDTLAAHGLETRKTAKEIMHSLGFTVWY